MRLASRTLAYILVAVTALVVAIPTVAAHAQFYKSEPAPGSRLDAVPAVVVVTLSEQVDPSGSGLEVLDSENRRVDTGPTRIENGRQPVFEADLRADLPEGVYRVKWKALSTVDGHITGGTFGFAVGDFEAPGFSESSERQEGWSIASRWVTYLGFALVIGAPLFLFLVEQRPVPDARQRFLGKAAMIGFGLLFLGNAGLFLHTWWKSGFGVTGFLATQVGARLGMRVAAAAISAATIGAIVAANKNRVALLGALVAALPLAFATSLFVHSANQGWFAVLIDFVHLVSVSAWLGGLGLFLLFLRHASKTLPFDEIRGAGLRFSRLALTSVILLGLTGIASSILILGIDVVRQPWALFTSSYGWALAGKIGLFGAMVALAGLNRFVFLGRRPGPDKAFASDGPAVLMPTDAAHTSKFNRTVAVEASLGLIVLGLAGLLTASSPPLDGASAAGGMVETMGESAEFNATLRARPSPRVGETSDVTVRVVDLETREPLLEAIRVRVRFLEPDANETGGLEYGANHTQDGIWSVGMVFFAEPGEHRVRITVQTEDVYRDMIELTVPVSAQAAGEGADVDVFLHDNPFHVAPDKVEAKTGTTVVLSVTNAGKAPHDLLVCGDQPPAPGDCANRIAATPLLPSNGTSRLEFAAPAPGSYDYYCTIPGHREAGMRGKLIIQTDAQTTPGLPFTWALALILILVMPRSHRR